MKKSLLRLMMTVCFIMATMSAKADTVGGLCGMEGDNMITWELNLDFGLLTIYGNGRMADFDDPSEAPWWSYSKSIIHLIVEDGITHISQAGFQYMPYLESAEIAETVTSIGDYAFYGSMLNKVIPTNWTGDIDANLLPNGLLTIGYYAFAETRLENIILPTTLERIGAAAFAYNDQLQEVATLATVPPAIERAVFYDCNKLWAIHVPDDQVEAYCNADGWATYTNIIVPASGHADHPAILPEENSLDLPGGMYVTDLGMTSALVICSLPDGATAWNLHYRQETADDEQEMRWVTVDNLTTRSCTLEDLKPATDYVVRLQAVFGEEVSGWTRALPFTTASEEVDRQNKQETAYYEYKEVKKAECDDMAMPEIDDKHCALFIEQAKQAIDDLGFNENLSFDENLANLDEITSLLAIDLSLHRAEMGEVRTAGVTIDETTFPDENFRNWLLKQKYGKDGILTEEEIAEVKTIDVAYQDIKSLKGIEYFTALETLFCDCNPLTGLDVSQNTALTYLYCAQCSLTSLDVTKNTALKWFSCPNNKLTSLDVTKNPALEYLYCIDNQLTEIDVTQNTALTSFSCYSNPITTLDVTNNTALSDFSCGGCKLTTLDVTKNTALKYFSCYGNQLTTLDISNNTGLDWVTCNDNQLTTLDVSKNAEITSIDCYNNQLTSLDVTNCTALESLRCNKNQLTSLDLTKNAALKKLECDVNQLSELDVTQNPELNWIVCGKNQLSSLDVSKNTKLMDLYCNENQLTSLDLSQNPVLNILDFHRNKIKGEAMDALIESLPAIADGREGTLRVIYDKDEQNAITADQIAAAQAKGWKPMYFDSYWKPYDATAINATLMDKGQMMNGARYNLSGQRVNDSYKGIVITNGKKFIMK